MSRLGLAFCVETIAVIAGVAAGVDVALHDQPDTTFLLMCLCIAIGAGLVLGLATSGIAATAPHMVWLGSTGGWAMGAVLYVALAPDIDLRAVFLAAAIASIPAFLVCLAVSLHQTPRNRPNTYDTQ